MFSSNGSQVSSSATYIEDVFSTYLYTGNGSTQTITNNIDLSTKKGMVFIKSRSSALPGVIQDTNTGVYKELYPTSALFANNYNPYGVSAFGTTGFSVTDDATSSYAVNGTSITYASWTFQKQPKFFDVVTYTGTGSNRTVAHSLGSVPGCIIVKRTDANGAWRVYHQSMTSASYYMALNTTDAQTSDSTIWNSTAPTSSVFSIGTDATVNASGGTYVAYIFAHNAGGFGLTGTDNVISCGTFTTDGSGNATVSLGYEPQFVMFKASSTTGDWAMVDTMRGLVDNPNTNAQKFLYSNLSNAESTGTGIGVLSTGFNLKWFANQTYIYIAIRRGPMKVPTDGTKVFTPVTATKSTANQLITSGFPVDLSMECQRVTPAGTPVTFIDRLRGGARSLISSSTAAEGVGAASTFDSMTQFNDGWLNTSQSSIFWFLRRAPGFFDEVCYTGTGSSATFSHNLGVVPELMITRTRSNSTDWVVYHTALGNTGAVFLDLTTANTTSSAWWNSTSPTSTQFTVGTAPGTNNSAWTFVAYLFASCPGVSKVGSYAGNGSSQTINCGFSAGARFILIKRTDGAGNWNVWDTARGINASGTNDPYLALNLNSAETTGSDFIDPSSSGFIVKGTGINNTGETYIYLAIA